MKLLMEILCEARLRSIVEIQDGRVLSPFFKGNRPIDGGEDDGPSVAGGYALMNHFSHFHTLQDWIGGSQGTDGPIPGEFADLCHARVTAPEAEKYAVDWHEFMDGTGAGIDDMRHLGGAQGNAIEVLRSVHGTQKIQRASPELHPAAGVSVRCAPDREAVKARCVRMRKVQEINRPLAAESAHFLL